MKTTLALVVFGIPLFFNLVFSSFLSSGNPKDWEKFKLINHGGHNDSLKDRLAIKLDTLLEAGKNHEANSRHKRQAVNDNVVILCDFDLIPHSAPPCDIRSHAADTNWVLRRGSTPTANTGVPSAQQGVTYLYMSGNPGTEGDIARVFVPVKYTGDICLSFYYSMYGAGVGTLEVRQYENDNQQHVVWAKHGNQGSGWKKVELNLRINADPTYLFWTGVRGRTAQSDMTIDYISATKGRCGGAICSATSCQWGSWSAGPTCSSTASQSIYLQQRALLSPPQCGGAACDGSSFQLVGCCQTIPCDRLSWAAWSGCSGGVRSRQRDESQCSQTKCASDRQTESCTDLFTCDFERDGCEVRAADSQWSRGNGKDQRNGPTSGSGGSTYFLYPLGNLPGELRRVATPPLAYTGTVKLSFAFYRSGSAMGPLMLAVVTDAGYLIQEIYNTPTTLNAWITTSIQFNIQAGNRITWMFTANNEDYALGLDNIVVTQVVAG